MYDVYIQLYIIICKIIYIYITSFIFAFYFYYIYMHRTYILIYTKKYALFKTKINERHYFC